MKRVYIVVAICLFIQTLVFSVYTKEFSLVFTQGKFSDFSYISNISFLDDGITLSYSSRIIFSGNESFVSWVDKLDKYYIFSTTGPNNIYRYSGTIEKVGNLFNFGMITKIKQVDKFLYILTGEKASIYKINDFEVKQLLNLDYGYIWDIFSLGGNYYIITGNPATIMRFDNGRYEVIFKSEVENHFLCVAIFNNIAYIGSSGSGTIYTFDGKNVKPLVSFDGSEITDIKVYGRYLVVSTYDILPKPQKNGTQQQQQAPSSPIDVLRNTKGNVYLLDPDTREYELLFSEVGISSIEILDSKIIAITSDGKLIEYESGKKRVSFFNKNFLKLFNFTNELLISSANPAELVSVNLSQSSYEGILETKEIPFGNLMNWGRISYDATLPDGSFIKIFVKGGNTPKEDKTWSQWIEAKEFLNLKPFQFIKIRVLLSAKKELPSLRSISIYFTPRNSSPRVFNIKSNLKDTNLELSWSVSDNDGDRLQFNVFAKNYNESKWQKLNKLPITDTNFSVSKFILGNGTFDFMIIADDAISNPVGIEKYFTNYLRNVLIDITPPYLDRNSLKIYRREDSVDVEFKVIDNIVLKEVYYSLDGVNWGYLLPMDYVIDSSSENFKITLKKSDFLNVLLIKMVDKQGNLSTDRVVF